MSDFGEELARLVLDDRDHMAQTAPGADGNRARDEHEHAGASFAGYEQEIARFISPGSGRPLTVEPWSEAADGALLLSGISDAIRKFVVLAPTDADMVALWVTHTHCFEVFLITPPLAITSPEKRSGKTTLLDVISPLVQRALPTVSISPAAMYRTVEIARPTLLIDEADNIFGQNGQSGQNDELRGILNSGHRRGGQVVRTVGDEHEPRVFSTHSPCAIALLGKLPCRPQRDRLSQAALAE
jgi:hypothetical protein